MLPFCGSVLEFAGAMGSVRQVLSSSRLAPGIVKQLECCCGLALDPGSLECYS